MISISVDDRLIPDRVILKGKITKVDSENSIVEAIAVKDGIILTTGTTEEINSLLEEKTKVIELNGKTVLPGFIDTHSQPGVAARTFLEIKL